MKPIRFSSRRDYQQALANYLSKEEVQAYTMAILSFFALAFFSIFAIRPTLMSFVSLQRQIEDATNIEKQLDTKINSLLKAQEEYQRNQAELALLSDALPNGPRFPELVRKMEGIINQHEATMSAFRTDEFSLLKQKNSNKTISEDVTSVNFSMTLLPTFSQGESIVKQLLNLRRIILLSSLGVKNISDTSTPKVETNVYGSAYFISEQE